MNFEEAVAYTRSLLRFGEKYGNERLACLLQKLGDPHEKLNVIHVAGTKGKGSTSTFAASVLKAAGYTVGSYLSPFVYDVRERVQVNGELIPETDFARLVSWIKPHVEAVAQTKYGQTTEFEIKTAIGLCYFAERHVDYAVLEVGLGGRLDATNVVPRTLVSVITNIGYDHVEILGHTLDAIAFEKGGIVRNNGICVTGVDGGPALGTIAAVCAERGASLRQVRASREWLSHADHSVTIRSDKRLLDYVKLRMRGRFQHANAALAVNALDAAQIPGLTDDAIRHGLDEAEAPGRLEVIRQSGPTIVVDGAHNELAAGVLSDSLAADFGASKRPVVAVVGMTRNHAPGPFLHALLRGLVPEALVATEPSFRPGSRDLVADAARALGVKRVELCPTVPEAAVSALELSSNLVDPLIILTGSFCTVGDMPPTSWQQLLSELPC